MAAFFIDNQLVNKVFTLSYISYSTDNQIFSTFIIINQTF